MRSVDKDGDPSATFHNVLANPPVAAYVRLIARKLISKAFRPSAAGTVSAILDAVLFLSTVKCVHIVVLSSFTNTTEFTELKKHTTMRCTQTQRDA